MAQHWLSIIKIYFILIHNIHVEDEKIRFGYYNDYAIY